MLVGGCSARDTPVPIPNTEVKPRSADGTAGEARWESTSPPTSHPDDPLPVEPVSSQQGVFAFPLPGGRRNPPVGGGYGGTGFPGPVTPSKPDRRPPLTYGRRHPNTARISTTRGRTSNRVPTATAAGPLRRDGASRTPGPGRKRTHPRDARRSVRRRGPSEQLAATGFVHPGQAKSCRFTKRMCGGCRGGAVTYLSSPSWSTQ
jgi:hypothetical protein